MDSRGTTSAGTSRLTSSAIPAALRRSPASGDYCKRSTKVHSRAWVEVGDGLRRGPAAVWPHAVGARIQLRYSGAHGAHPDDTWTSPRSGPHFDPGPTTA